MAKKTWLAFFQSHSRVFLPTNTLSNVGEYARDHIQARKRQVKFRRRLFTSSINRKIKQFDVVVVQKSIKVDEEVRCTIALFHTLLGLPVTSLDL